MKIVHGQNTDNDIKFPISDRGTPTNSAGMAHGFLCNAAGSLAREDATDDQGIDIRPERSRSGLPPPGRLDPAARGRLSGACDSGQDRPRDPATHGRQRRVLSSTVSLAS